MAETSNPFPENAARESAANGKLIQTEDLWKTYLMGS